MKKQALGTHTVAKICQVTPPTIVRWMEEGGLPFFTTLGGHRRIWNFDLIRFLREHNIPIPDRLQSAVSREVLIVDDEEEIRNLIRRCLQKFFPGVGIQEAADGFEAGHKLALRVPSLVVLDLKLPGVDGFGICRTIRAEERLKGIRILAVSGHNVQESGGRILQAGADDFLGKPFDMDALREKIAGIMKKEGWDPLSRGGVGKGIEEQR